MPKFVLLVEFIVTAKARVSSHRFSVHTVFVDFRLEKDAVYRFFI